MLTTCFFFYVPRCVSWLISMLSNAQCIWLTAVSGDDDVTMVLVQGVFMVLCNVFEQLTSVHEGEFVVCIYCI